LWETPTETFTGGDGADGLPAPVAVEDRGAFVVDDGSAAADLALSR
jgi:hypothetical protein